MLKDIESEKPQLLMHFEDDIQAKRAIQTALREPKSVYAQFPDKFVLIYCGSLEPVDNTKNLLHFFNQKAGFEVCSVLSLVEVKK